MLLKVLGFFPGVPIFFLISGYLISLSYERNSKLKPYLTNRGLRIYPALWACLMVGILSIFWVTGLPEAFFTKKGAIWVFAQCTIGQFYNPEFLRGYGVGVLNGSLWTIPVELQFYLFVPIIYAVFKKRIVGGLLFLVCLSIASQEMFIYLKAANNQEELALGFKLFGVSAIPYLWMFLIGILIQRFKEKLFPYVKNKGFIWLVVYLAITIGFGEKLRYSSNTPNPFTYILLALTIFSLAYTFPKRGWGILKKHDLSYGVYIYHMLVINVLIEIWPDEFSSVHLLIVLGLTIGLAVISWTCIEKPTLKLKTGNYFKTSTRGI